MSGAIPSPSERATSITKSNTKASHHSVKQSSEHGSRVSKADSGISQAILSIAQKIASMPPSNASMPVSAARSNGGFEEVGEGVSLGLHAAKKGSNDGSARSKHSGFGAKGMGIDGEAGSKAASDRSANIGFQEVGVGRTRSRDAPSDSGQKAASRTPSWKAQSQRSAPPGFREVGTGTTHASAEPNTENKAASQRSARTLQTITHSFGGFGTLDENQAAGISALQQWEEKVTARSNASRAATVRSVPPPAARPTVKPASAASATRSGRPDSAPSQHSKPRDSVRQSIEAPSATTQRTASWVHQTPSIYNPAQPQATNAPSVIAHQPRVASAAPTARSGISVQPSPYPYASGQSTPFAGQGWISPHPLSVAPSHVGDSPQRAVKIPGLDTMITYDEWKAQRDSKEDVRVHSGSRFGTASRVPSIAASRIVSPVYNAEPPLGYVGSYRVSMQYAQEREARSEQSMARRSQVNEQPVSKQWSGSQRQTVAPQSVFTQEHVQSRHGQGLQESAQSYKPASAPSQESPAPASHVASRRQTGGSGILSTPSHDSPTPTARERAPAYTVGLTPAELQDYQAQLEETVSRLSARLSQVEHEHSLPQPDYSNWDGRFGRSPAPSPQASAHNSASRSLSHQHRESQLGETGSRILSNAHAASVRSGAVSQTRSARSSRHSAISRHDY